MVVVAVVFVVMAWVVVGVVVVVMVWVVVGVVVAGARAGAGAVAW